MAAKWIETITGPLEQKKQYREAKARLETLPEPYRATGIAVHRYLLACGGVTEGDVVVQMLLDLVDLWERAALDSTPVNGLVGDDPVEFAESFARAYNGKHWMDRERARLTAAFPQPGAGSGSAASSASSSEKHGS